MLKIIKKEGNARRCEFETVHGTVQTPAFMNVATCGAIKGGLNHTVSTTNEDVTALDSKIAGFATKYETEKAKGEFVFDMSIWMPEA